MAAGIAGRGRHQSSTAPVLIAVALLTVFVVGVVQGRSPCSSTGAFGRGQVMALGIGGAEAVGNYGEMMQLRRCSHQLHLRGGDDEDEGEAADEAEGGAEEGDGEGEKEEDSDAGPMTLTKAIKQVLYYARIHHGVAKGLKEVCQALERGEAQLVILAEDCDHEEYTKLVNALTADKGVYLIKVPEKAKLGDWAGQHKLDTDAKVKKTCKASCVAIKDFGEQSEGLAFLLHHIKSQEGSTGGGTAAAEGEEGEERMVEDEPAEEEA